MRDSDIRNTPIGTEIEVYKTLVEKGTNEQWDDTRSFVGTAKVSSPSIVSRAIDVTSWVEK